jgi:hypothetical protein
MSRGLYVIIQTIMQKGEGKGLQLSGLDIKRIIIVFIVTLLVLYGGRAASYSLQVRRPLHEFFTQQTEVIDYSVQQGREGICVRVELDDAQLWAGIAEVTGRIPAVLDVTDRRNHGLEETFRSMRIHIEEALATGSFYAMAQAIDEEAKEAGLDRWSVGVDSDYVYVQLHKGESYLYEIIPRRAQAEQRPPVTVSGLQSTLSKRSP